MEGKGREEAASRLFIAGRNTKLVSPGEWQDSNELNEVALPEGMVIDQVFAGHDHYLIIDSKYTLAIPQKGCVLLIRKFKKQDEGKAFSFGTQPKTLA